MSLRNLRSWDTLCSVTLEDKFRTHLCAWGNDTAYKILIETWSLTTIWRVDIVVETRVKNSDCFDSSLYYVVSSLEDMKNLKNLLGLWWKWKYLIFCLNFKWRIEIVKLKKCFITFHHKMVQRYSEEVVNWKKFEDVD